ncbi:MAG: hypothetical protein ACLQGP_32845 [Isosphaeraceae bacterium]
MANANAIVDQLVGLGLRHGEKAGMALASMIFFVCVGTAATQKGIDLTPDQVKKAADQSETNLNRREDRETIVKILEEREKITKTNFAESVEEQIKVALVPDNYKPAREWVTPEPGAGLIRDTPKLVAVNELYAYPGRGGLLVYALDEKGERIPAEEGDEVTEKKQRLGNTRRPKGAGGGMGGMMGGGAGQKKKKKAKSKVEIERERKEELERLARQKKALLSGGTVADTKEAKAETEEDDGGPYKEITKGYRWVAITGTLDHGQMLAYYREALKNPAIAHPHYARLDLQRKILQIDGTWTDWQDVDAKKNYEILDNIPEVEEELAPETVLPKNLVDRLPFLKAGLWEKVHIASLVPKEKVVVPDEKAAPGGMRGRGGMMGGGMMGRGMMGGGMMGPMGEGGGGPGGMAEMMKGQSNRMMMGGGMAEMGGGMSMGGSSETVGNFWKSEEKKVMIRALDFTTEPDVTYRYRVRIVVFNPNYNRDDVSPGTDNKKKTLLGPWSKETDPVTMPPDVMPYAVSTLPKNAQSDTKVRFDVVRFHPSDGVTVPYHFDASVGGLIGERRRTDVPVSDGSGKKSEPIDFTTHQLVVDVTGGEMQLLPPGFVGTPIERPALTVLLRPDGSVAVHNEAEDLANEVRKDIDSTYRHEIEQSNKKRKNSQGSGYSSMMGGGMMGGGMRGGGMMGGGMMGGGRR